VSTPAVTAPRGPWDLEVTRDHLAVFRVAFFAVLAVDAFLQIAQAPRYGAGDFNVPHLAWLPLPSPGREGALALHLASTYLFTLAALGVATRLVVPLAAAIAAYLYFASQLDSYQHRYLVVLLLGIACFVPWHARTPRVRAWALRLFLVQIAIVYAWAAIAKLDPLWLDGTALDAQLHRAWVRDATEALPGGYATLSVVVLATELLLVAGWLQPRLWPLALPAGVLFHVGIELAGFRIGQFSYLMLAIYLLLVPPRVAGAPARALAAAAARLGPATPPRRPLAIGAAALAGAALLGGLAAAAARVPVPAALIAASLAIAGLALALERRWTVGAAHLTAWLLVLLLGRVTDQAIEYHRYWASAARRFGEPAEMRRAYRQLLRLDPEHGPANYYLGAAALEASDLERALAHFRRAQAAQPHAARGWIGEARVWMARGDGPRARAALQEALRVEPRNPEARALRRRLGLR
jgi:tetratricopeptide (TPR) repeat protein